MIQRIQTLWLLLSGLIYLLLARLPIYAGLTIDNTTVRLMTAERLHLMIIGILLLVMPLIAIFLFKNRSSQKKIIWLHILMSLLMLLFIWMAKDAFINVEPAYEQTQYGFGVAVPVFSIIFDIMAYRGIRQDEALIKSADKLR
jgi:multisubunit Na+/H+ antiporter MnhC subunit